MVSGDDHNAPANGHFLAGRGLVKLNYPRNSRSVFAFRRSLAKLPAMKFVATLDRDEDGIWISECPAIPGCVSQGSTRDEALANIREAIALCLEVRAERGTDHRNSANRSHGLNGDSPVAKWSRGPEDF